MKVEISRRDLIRGAGLTTIGLAVGGAIAKRARAGNGSLSSGAAEEVGPGPVPFELSVNGRKRAIKAEPRVSLLRILRNDLDLTGPKEVCDRGACGACTVLLDGKPVNSCLMLALDARGREITTIEGLGTAEAMDPLQESFCEKDGLMCGFCTPGMVMSARALLNETPQPSEAQIRHAVAGNLCRCGTYPKVFEAVADAAGKVGRRG